MYSFRPLKNRSRVDRFSVWSEFFSGSMFSLLSSASMPASVIPPCLKSTTNRSSGPGQDYSWRRNDFGAASVRPTTMVRSEFRRASIPRREERFHRASRCGSQHHPTGRLNGLAGPAKGGLVFLMRNRTRFLVGLRLRRRFEIRANDLSASVLCNGVRHLPLDP
jgi:hypothetical protein